MSDKMYVQTACLTFHIPYASSLKDKRQVARSIIDKTRHKFNASVAEVNDHDSHQRLVVGISLVSSTSTHAQKCMDEIMRFMEENAKGADLVEVEIWQD